MRWGTARPLAVYSQKTATDTGILVSYCRAGRERVYIFSTQHAMTHEGMRRSSVAHVSG